MRNQACFKCGGLIDPYSLGQMDLVKPSHVMHFCGLACLGLHVASIEVRVQDMRDQESDDD